MLRHIFLLASVLSAGILLGQQGSGTISGIVTDPQNAAVAGLFRAYWRDGRDIGDRSVLAQVAAPWLTNFVKRLLSWGDLIMW